MEVLKGIAIGVLLGLAVIAGTIALAYISDDMCLFWFEGMECIDPLYGTSN